MSHNRFLLVYPEFPETFWSFKHTLRFIGKKALMLPLGLATIGGMVGKEYTLSAVDLNVSALSDAQIREADLVLMSAMLIQKESFHTVIRRCKRLGKPVAVGGPYPTECVEELSSLPPDQRPDFFILDEGEVTFPLFLKDWEKGTPQPLYRSKEKPSLDRAPIPRFDLFDLNAYNVLPLQFSRGCPFDCEFCDIVHLFGRVPRTKSPAQFLTELETALNLGFEGNVFIVDDNFIGNPTHAREMLARITPWQAERQEPFTFWTQVSVNLAQDRDLIDRMTAANFSHVFIGVESPDPEVLRGAHKHQNIAHPLVESLCTIRDNGLTIVGSFIMGFDNETAGVGERIAALVDAAALPNAILHILTPLPNTRLWHRLKEEGRLEEDRFWKHNDDMQAVEWSLFFQPTRPAAEILEEFHRLGHYLYNRASFMDRAYRYFLAMRPTRAALAKAQGQPPPPDAGSAKPPSLEKIVQDLSRFCRLAWRQGVKPAARRQYWSQFFGLLRRNPSRMVGYLKSMAMAEEVLLMQESL